MSRTIKIANQGKSVGDAADWETTLSDRFKGLPIVASGAFTSTTALTIQTIHTHNLGYKPMFVVYRQVSTGVWELATTGYAQFLYVTSTQLRFDNTSLGFAETFAYFIFGVDLETNIAEVTDDTSEGVAVSGGRRLQIRNDGGLDTTGKQNDIDTKYPPLIIQKLVNQSYTAGNTDTISHALGVIPYFQVFWSNAANTRYYLLYNASDSNVGVSTTQVAYSFTNAPTGCKISTVIFKRRINTA